MKRFASFILAILVMLCSSALGAGDSYICDLNNDGLMNNRDAVIIAMHAGQTALLDLAGQAAADVTLDGIIDENDVSEVLRVIVGLGELPLTSLQTVEGVVYSVSHGNAVIKSAQAGLTQATVAAIGPHAVTTIGEGAFENQTELTCVTLPDTITVIGKRAFAGCASLKELQ